MLRRQKYLDVVNKLLFLAVIGMGAFVLSLLAKKDISLADNKNKPMHTLPKSFLPQEAQADDFSYHTCAIK